MERDLSLPPVLQEEGMDLAAIKERLWKEKDQLFSLAREWKENNPDLYPCVGALLSDGKFSTWSLGMVPGAMMPAALQQVSLEIRKMGAVAALFFADSEFESVDGKSAGHSLFCYLTATNWEEVWVWRYQEGEEGLVWDEATEPVNDFTSLGAGFSPFPQVPVLRGVVH